MKVSILLTLGGQIASMAADGPCDIYKSGGTPCVAAFSTVRALYSNYTGKLYQVRNGNQTKDIGVLSAGYVANSASQDSFCTAKGSCTISKIYDQSGNGNDLIKGQAGNKSYGPYADEEAVADDLPVKVDGHKVYGVHVKPGSWTAPGQVGYRCSNPKGTAKGDDPESEYMIADGTFVNGACCFDFGNAETDPLKYTSMDAIYFGTNNWWDVGTGSGPWIMADLENGVYNHGGATTNRVHLNSNAPSFTNPFVTAMLKNNKAGASGGPFTIKGGNSQSGALTTVWDGARPDGYGSLGKAGGIVLGIGGDNSSGARGNFYEGIMTSGFATSATDALIQANIVAAGYGRTTTSIENRMVDRSPVAFHFDPVSRKAHLHYAINGSSRVNVSAIDQLGRPVATVVDGIQPSGPHEIVWDASHVRPGVYFLRTTVEDRVSSVEKVLVGG
jgi:hypothetical protein